MDIKIGKKGIGDGYPCFVIAEIGSNHNNDFNLAIEMIDAAVDSNVDAVKFQAFKASEHYSKYTPGFEYLDNTDTHELIKSLEINREWHSDLKDYAEKKDVIFFSSPCDSDAIHSLSKLNVELYKVASFDLTDDRLISEIASLKKPLILSTGLANWMDIQIAIDTAKKVGNEDIILLQCTSLYPAPVNLANLKSMQSMRSAFGTLVGYSDHTQGDHIPLAAASMGACVIEKHFTIDRKLPGPDHSFAMEPDEMLSMMKKLREIESSIGDGEKNGPRKEELEMYEKGRRSIHAKVDINEGQEIKDDMISIKRPGLGIHPSQRQQIIGRKSKRLIKADEWITWEMV